MSGTLSRELTARIVKDLARASRSVPVIASRYRVPESTVVALRDFYGPGIPQLIDAAEELRRVAKQVKGMPPVGPLAVSGTAEEAAPSPEPGHEESEAKPRRSDGLTSAERVDCRSWCAATGREVGSFGMIARDVVDAWDDAGRPTPAVVDAEPVEESDDDGVVDVPIVEDAGRVSWPAYIAMETPEAARILASAKVALTDVADILPWAVEHCPDAVWGDVVDAWDDAGRPTPAVVDAEPVEESDDDGVVDVPIVEDAGRVSWPAYIAMETPEAARILASAKVALTDVADILPWAVEHCPDAVWDWVGKSAELTDTVAVERIEHDRVQAAAQVLYELALQGLLQPTPDALHRAAQLALAAAEAA